MPIEKISAFFPCVFTFRLAGFWLYFVPPKAKLGRCKARGLLREPFGSLQSLHDKAFAFVFKKLSGFKINGAENGTRTRDPHLGKVVLYQLSYFRLYFKPHIWLESYFDDSFLHCLVFKEHLLIAKPISASQLLYYTAPENPCQGIFR